MLEFTSKNKTLNEKKYKTSICKKCGKEFKSVKGKIYCSEQCKYEDKKYPNIEEINERYNELGSWEKVAESFSLTRKIINGIRKKSFS